ncbi:MAG: tRNA 2-thiouridine(34) synthase MnmA [Opitutales bacterium]|nr:tRNA 2-thiouridine(34) synthase MnmA [Opitutales bacterium]
MAKILVALSGGVDSAVAAHLLKEQGHEVSAAYMKNWINEENVFGNCPWEEDIRDAEAVCKHLEIPFEVGNFIKDYRERVVQYLVEGYKKGITPNPDVMCNREMKFGVFLDYALKNGFEAVATGHYCQSVIDASGINQVYEGIDKNKDQSYFLALVKGNQMDHARFPIGHLQKTEVRKLAKQAGLPNAAKKDSQGICFIGQVKITDFLEKFIPDNPGEIVNLNGTVLGEHKGLHRFTLGQRKGIGVPSNTDNQFYVVVGKDYDTNRLIIAFESNEENGLYCTEKRVHSLSWIRDSITDKCKLLARPRYRDPSVVSDFRPLEDGSIHLTFHEPQRAIAAGQICAFYDNERLLGGGVFL